MMQESGNGSFIIVVKRERHTFQHFTAFVKQVGPFLVLWPSLTCVVSGVKQRRE